MKDTLVREVMTPCVEVLRHDAKVSDARKHICDGLFHHLPVVSPDGVLLGLVSSSDLVALSFDAYGVDGARMDAVIDQQFTLKEVMRTELVTVGPDDKLSCAAELLSEGSLHALPVVDRGRHFVGLVTSADLIAYLLSELR